MNEMKHGSNKADAKVLDIRVNKPPSGFTLIELLVAVTILAVMTLIISRIVSQTNSAITANTRQAIQNANARMALDFMSEELNQAVADARLKFQRDENPSFPVLASVYGNSSFPCHELRFVAFTGLLDPADASQDREAVRIAYYVRNVGGTNSLWRSAQPIAPQPNQYTNVWMNFVGPSTPPAARESEIIAHVVEFRVVCHDTNATTVMDSSEYDHLPAYLDVYLALLSDPEARRAKTFADGSTNQQDYVFRHAKRYHTRCLSLNREAYIRGR
jgi:prepilin-type N-terminal cleavage/methylation domain-containing protein